MAGCAAVEFAWWLLCWMWGVAPLPFIGTYLLIALLGLGAAWTVRLIVARRKPRAGLLAVAAAVAFVAIAASLFLPLKFAIPKLTPFWLDLPVVRGERALLGTDAWVVADRVLGWAAVPVDRLYGAWLPVQTLILFSVVLLPPSRRKSRTLIAYSLGWMLLGVGAALAFSSAGPLFYDRVFGESHFAALRATLNSRGAWVALAESDQMWAAYEQDSPGLVAGISALPSLHVAISFWIYLATRALNPRVAPVALAYALFMWVASVQLGWHYVADGLLGIAGMTGIWIVAEPIDESIRRACARFGFVDSDAGALTAE